MKGFYELLGKVCQVFGFRGQERSKQTRAQMHRTSISLCNKKKVMASLKLGLRGCMYLMKSPSLVLGERS